MGARVLTGASLVVVAALAQQALARDNPALLQALRSGDDAWAAELVDRHTNLNSRDETGATPLMWAAQHGNLDLTRRLLKGGADPNLRDDEGLGPLQVALEVRATEIALELIAHRADAKAVRDSGETVLMTAARTGQLAVMKQLIARGADVNARESQFHQTALMWSAGYPQEVELLIEHGADIHARTKVWQITDTIYTQLMHEGSPWLHDGEFVIHKGGQSALFFAVQQNDVESVKELLDAGAAVDERSADGSTALLLALYKWNRGEKRRYSFVCDLDAYPVSFAPTVAIANVLLDRGASAEVADFAGYTPLHGAVLGFIPQKCRNSAIQIEGVKAVRETAVDALEGLALAKRLLDLKADPNAATRYPTAGPIGHVRINPAPVGSTPVQIAAETGNVQLMALLLDHGGNPNLIRSGDGHSALSAATRADDLPMVELLIEHRGDVERSYDPADLIVDVFNDGNGFQIEKTRRDQSLLHVAAVAGSYKVVPFLVAHGAPVDRRNASDETPLALAENQERVRYARNRREAIVARDMLMATDVRDPDSIVLETHTSEAIEHALQAKATAFNLSSTRKARGSLEARQ